MANDKNQSKDKVSTDNVANQGEPKTITATRLSVNRSEPEYAHFTDGEWADREKEGWTRVDTPVTEFPSTDAPSGTSKKSKNDV